jgi:N utilization substance protein B
MGRHKAREIALTELYATEVGGKIEVDILDLPLSPDSSQKFSKELTIAVQNHLNEIDSKIVTHTPEWPLHRMPVLDRIIIRLAVAEMLYFPEIPFEVAVDEAVELAKKYGDVNSPAFINGVLAAIHRESAAPLQLPE